MGLGLGLGRNHRVWPMRDNNYFRRRRRSALALCRLDLLPQSSCWTGWTGRWGPRYLLLGRADEGR
jgi:hypothetical protein